MSAFAGFRSFAVIPAAGRSRRMGRPKLLLPWGARTVIEHILAAWRGSRISHVVVVVHPDDRDLAAVCRATGVEVVVPDPPPADMKGSVRHGLADIAARWSPEPNDAWLLAPADIPYLSTDDIDRVLAAHDPRQPRIFLPQCAGRGGHPVLFPWPLAAEVAGLPPDAGVNELLHRHPVERLEFPNPTIWLDLDTPDDYRRLHGRYDPHNRPAP